MHFPTKKWPYTAMDNHNSNLPDYLTGKKAKGAWMYFIAFKML